MVTLSVDVKRRVADWTPSVSLPQIFSGSCNIDYVKFNLDEEWKTFTGVKALFSDGKELYEVQLDDHNVAEIPSRITEKPCFMKIGITGISDEEEVITSSILVYQIGKGSSTRAFLGDAAFKSLNEKLEQCLKMRSMGDVEAEYYLSDSAIVSYDESNWKNTTQTPTTNMPYLWCRFKFLYTNGEFDYTEPAIISTKGDQGIEGKQGEPGSIDNLPIATNKILGGVMPVKKTDDMGLPVGVDGEGKLWSTGGTFTITYKNGDQVVKEETLVSGFLPAYDGADLTGPNGAPFDKWEPPVASVTADATYTAKFKHKVTLVSGFLPAYDGADLTGPNGAPFDKWEPPVASVTADATYTAKFKHKVTYYSNDGSSVLSTEFVKDGEYPRLAPRVTGESGAKHSGWAKSVNASEPDADALDTVHSDLNLYATFDIPFHTVPPTTSTVPLEPDGFYSFGEVTSLSYSLANGSQGKEWKFSFISGETATMVTHPADVMVGDFEVDTNARIEVSILQDGNKKYLVYKAWELST